MEFFNSFPRAGFHVITVLGVAVSTVFLLRYFFKTKLVDKLVRDQVFKLAYDIIEYAITIILTAVVTTSQTYNVLTWNEPTKSLYATGFFAFLITAVGYGKYLRSHITLGESTKIKELETDKAILAQSRNWQVRIGATIDVIVSEKFKNLEPLLEKKCVNPTEIVSIESIQRQILINVQQIHEQFSSSLAPGQSLRLGIYFRSETIKDQLELGYCWDGKRENCYSGKSASLHKIVLFENVLCELGKCYSSKEGMILIPSCPQAAKEDNFRYLHTGQESKIKSMLLYRSDFRAPKSDPWIISLDSSQEGFFESTKKEDYKIFLERVSKRISFELVTLMLASKFCNTHEHR